MREEPPIRVLVADDQAIVREGLATVLALLPDVEVVGTAADGEEAVALAVQRHPDVVLMDLRMPRLDGVAATARLVVDVPSAAVLVLTTFADDESIVAALTAGAKGYLTKDAGRAELAAAVRSVARGQAIFSAEVGATIVDSLTRPRPTTSPGEGLAARFPRLTRREIDVLALLVEGCTNAEIAERLFVEVSTVKTHVIALFAKLGVRDRRAAVALARR
ncbi:response regulator containing a CheY-like receiver domain and an HTH DNA-binding domain [Microbacterium testaceum StLB037]|uniref:Response regulator containing a CheY-like receiver domain and an HTH DNA-binding domain n=1 Tax=Microbacterium testaceum (strain StLB037) TaxID=979556 RepID=E8N8W6_MICTS|nr:response regulator transcription factor [Microbacterium testaceum]BAJ73175.1 response regulator containing a CheY-like receiver domain and an HTH DNA-binding domain [Microbacterium testaceum StLB037]